MSFVRLEKLLDQKDVANTLALAPKLLAFLSGLPMLRTGKFLAPFSSALPWGG